MKKLFAILLVLMLAVSGLAMAEEDTSVENILEKGTFILGLDDSFPPMGFRDENNDIVGFDIDVAKEVAARLGVEFIAQPISWDAKELELASGTIDWHLERHVHHARTGGKHGHDLPLPQQPDDLLHPCRRGHRQPGGAGGQVGGGAEPGPMPRSCSAATMRIWPRLSRRCWALTST